MFMRGLLSSDDVGGVAMVTTLRPSSVVAGVDVVMTISGPTRRRRRPVFLVLTYLRDLCDK